MAKPISDEVNQRIVDEYSTGQISQAKLALKLEVSKSHIFKILKRSRSGNSQHQADLAVLKNLKKFDSGAISSKL